MTRRFVLAIVLGTWIGSVLPAAAHPGHTHKVMGTVSMRHENHLEIKSVDGKTVTVTVNDRTKILRGKRTTTLDDIKDGERVVVSAKEEKGKDGKAALVATEIRLAERSAAALR